MIHGARLLQDVALLLPSSHSRPPHASTPEWVWLYCTYDTNYLKHVCDMPCPFVHFNFAPGLN